MKKQILIVIAILTVILLVSLFVDKTYNSNNKKETETKNKTDNFKGDAYDMIEKINIIINGENYTATLENNETSKEFIEKLPLTITMNELNGNEKYYYFDDSLTSNLEKVNKINTGDIMLYGKDCLVLFYDTFNTSYTYTRIGKIDNPASLKSKLGSGSIQISITK